MSEQTEAKQRPMQNRIRGMIFAMLGGICWGFSGTCGQFLFTYTEVDVQLLSCVRMILAGVLLLAFGWIRQKDRVIGVWRTPQDVLRLFLFSLCGLLVCQYTYLTAISYSNAGTATVLQYLAPVIIMAVLCLRRHRLPTARELAALVLALIGTYLLATHGDPGNLAISRQGLLWGLAAAVGMVLYSMLPGSLMRKWGSLVVTGYGLLIAGIAMSLATRIWRVRIHMDLPTVLGIAGVTLIGTLLAYTMYLQGVTDIGADYASLFACTEPVAATLFAAIWLKTTFLPVDLIGFAAILSAVVILSLRNRQREIDK